MTHDRRTLELWIRNLPTANRTLPLVVALQDGLLHGRWPWSDKRSLCSVCQSEWTNDKQDRPGRRLQMRFCNAVLGHDGAYSYGDWS